MSPLRILMVADVFCPDQMGGSKRYIYDISRCLVEKGHEVHVLVPCQVEGVPLEEDVDGIHVHRFLVNHRSSFLLQLSIVMGARRRFESLVREVRFDLLHLHHLFSAFAVVCSCNSSKFPRVVNLYCPASEEMRAEYEYYRYDAVWLKRLFRGLCFNVSCWVINWIERYTLRCATQIFVLSLFTAGQLKSIHRIGGAKVKLVPGAVDLSRFKPSSLNQRVLRAALDIQGKGPLLLTVRRLVPRMGLDVLIRAIPAVLRGWPNLHLLIGGEGPLKGSLKDLVAELCISDHVHFLGFIPEEQLAQYYQSVDCFILPTSSLEGFGIVTAEAMACGTTVLATPVGANVELLGGISPEWLFAGSDSASMTRGILSWLSRQNEPKIDLLRRRALKMVREKYSLEAVVVQIEARYEELQRC